MGKLFLQELERPLDLGRGHRLPNTYQCGPLPGESPKAQDK